MGRKRGETELENMIEMKVDIVEYIDSLDISEDNKNSLKYWITERNIDGTDFISGMALALQHEKKITPEDFITIVMWESKMKKEEPKWKTFLRNIRFLGQ